MKSTHYCALIDDLMQVNMGVVLPWEIVSKDFHARPLAVQLGMVKK